MNLHEALISLNELVSKVAPRDRRLTPSALLLYHTLVSLCNQAHWADNFIAPDPALAAATHLSKQAITKAKRILKSLGYIDFFGKPTHYHLTNALVGYQVGRPDKGKASSPSPTPPSPTPKEIITKKKEEMSYVDEGIDEERVARLRRAFEQRE